MRTISIQRLAGSCATDILHDSSIYIVDDDHNKYTLGPMDMYEDYTMTFLPYPSNSVVSFSFFSKLPLYSALEL